MEYSNWLMCCSRGERVALQLTRRAPGFEAGVSSEPAAEPSSDPPPRAPAELSYNRVAGLADRYGTPLFVYQQSVIDDAVAAAAGMLPAGAGLCFAVKANPARGILQGFVHRGLGAEVASAGELAMALDAGFAAEKIVFSGPAKTKADHATAVKAGIAALHIESRQELGALQEVCAGLGQTAKVALRINFAAAAGSRRLGWGAQTPFGMTSEEAVDIGENLRAFPHLALIGLHHHAASQVLDGERLARRIGVFAAFCGEWRARFGLAYANIGGGLGIPEYADDAPLDLAPVERILAELARAGAPFAGLGAGLVAEPGRFLIGPAGAYVARVVRTREIGGTAFAFLDGGTHHVHRLSGTQRALRRPVAVSCLRPVAVSQIRPFELAGPLCTPVDRLASGALLPADLAPGDLLLFRNVGAYAKHASPLGFLGHDLPAEVLIAGEAEELIAAGRPIVIGPDAASAGWP